MLRQILIALIVGGAAAAWAAYATGPVVERVPGDQRNSATHVLAESAADVVPAIRAADQPVPSAPTLAPDQSNGVPSTAEAAPPTGRVVPDPDPAPANMTASDRDAELARAAGQLIMVGFFGRTTRDANVQQVLAAIRTGTVGGVIVMDRNIANLRQVKALVAMLQDAAPADTPLLISVDQEGGAVQRIDAPPGRRRRFPSAWRLARAGDMARVQATYETMSRQLADLGFNLNFGPVVDLRLNPRNPIIARKNRSFGDDPGLVADYARVFIDSHHREGVATTLKHFPGHGSSRGDTHEGFVNITRPFRDIELAPYAKLMATGHADAIMMGHLAHAAFGTKSETDDRPMPASLSATAITKVLRHELGFEGVVITDDLAMGAIKRYFDFGTTVQKALVAGNDILLMTSGPRNLPDLGTAMHAAVLKAVRDGVVPRAQVLRSAARVRELKASVAAWSRNADARRARERAERLAEAVREAERKRAEADAGRTEAAAPRLKGAVE